MIVLKDHEIAEEMDLCEVSQASNMKFSIALKEKGKQVYHRMFGLVKCRDFFNDFFIDQFNQRSQKKTVYGFFTEPGIIKKKKLYLIISVGDTNKASSIVKIVSDKLVSRGMKPLRVIVPNEIHTEDLTEHDMKYHKDQIIVDVPSVWFRNSYNIMTLTYLLRIEDKVDEYCEIAGTFKSTTGKEPSENIYALVDAVPYTPDLRDSSKVYTGWKTAEEEKHYLHDMGLSYFLRNGFKEKLGQAGDNKIAKVLSKYIPYKESF